MLSVADQIRLHTWATSWKVGLAYPWLGSGGESYVHHWRAFRDPAWVSLVGDRTYQDQAHNLVLMAWAGFGLAGVLSLGLLSRYVWDALRRSGAKGSMTPPAMSQASGASLVAVLICSMFNAIPFAVVFCMALIFGSLDTESWRQGIRDPRPVRILSAGLAALSLWLLGADMVYKLGRLRTDTGLVATAGKLNPAEIVYQIGHIQMLEAGYEQQKDPGYLIEALTVARSASLLHPASVQAFEAMSAILARLERVDPGFGPAARRVSGELTRRDPISR